VQGKRRKSEGFIIIPARDHCGIGNIATIFPENEERNAQIVGSGGGVSALKGTGFPKLDWITCLFKQPNEYPRSSTFQTRSENCWSI
jgi:hypothetical protein